MKKIILGAGVFTSVVASTLGDTCSRCGKEMVVESREPGMCIDCYRRSERGYSECQVCHRIVKYLTQGKCLVCHMIKDEGYPRCESCKRGVAGPNDLCNVCRWRREGKTICRHCNGDIVDSGKFSQGLCLDCWRDSSYSVCPKCHSAQLARPDLPMCSTCWKKDDASLCKKCKEAHCNYFSDMCVHCGCVSGFGCTDDYTSGFGCDDSHGSFGCDEPYGF